MKKNKKIWSYALAAALAVSNLSVVAAPFSSMVVNAAFSAGATLGVENTTAPTRDGSTGKEFHVGDVLAFAETGQLTATADAPISVSIGGAATTATGSIFKQGEYEGDKEWTVPATAAGQTLAFSANDGAAITSAGTLTVASHTYNLVADGSTTPIAAGDTFVPGRSYAISVFDGTTTEDVTAAAKVRVTCADPNVSFSNNTLTVGKDAVENAAISFVYKDITGTDQPAIACAVAADPGTVESFSSMSVLSTKTEYTSGDSDVHYINAKLPTIPEGYTPAGAIAYTAGVVSGTGITVGVATTSNDFPITVNSVTKKQTVKVKYTAEVTYNHATKPDITYYSELEKTYMVYPTATYTISVEGANEDPSSTPLAPVFILKEEEGELVLTANFSPASTDMPTLTDDDVDFVWAKVAASSAQISKLENADTKSVTIYPKTSPFTVTTGQQITLDILDKTTGVNIPGTATLTIDINFESNVKPSIEASAEEAIVDGDPVKLTVKDENGKVLKDLTGYTVSATPATGWTLNTDQDEITFSAAGTYDVTVKKTTGPSSDPVRIIARTEDGVKATGIKLDMDQLTYAATSNTIVATVLPVADPTATPPVIAPEIDTITVTSSDEDVIPNTGIAIANNAANTTSTVTLTPAATSVPGITTLTFTTDDGGFTATCEVTVPGYKGIVLTSDTTEVGVGETLTIDADVQIYGDSFSKDITWHSSDESVATVKDGVVTGVAEGTAKIYAVAKNDPTKKSNEIEITVVDNTIPNAIAAAEAAADAAKAAPSDASIQAAKDAVAAAEKAGATTEQLKSANAKIAEAEAANEAAKKAAEEEAKKKAEEEQKKAEEAKKSDGSEAGKPAPVGNELKDANGNPTGFYVTNATAGSAEVEYRGTEADKKQSSVTIPDTIKDANGNEYKVTGIAANAFKDSEVKTVTIGKNIKSIDKNAFKDSKVKTVKIKGTKLTKKMAKNLVKSLKKGAKIKVSGKNKKKNKELLNKQSKVKNGKIKVK